MIQPTRLLYLQTHLLVKLAHKHPDLLQQLNKDQLEQVRLQAQALAFSFFPPSSTHLAQVQIEAYEAPPTWGGIPITDSIQGRLEAPRPAFSSTL